jgi:hypothetical protein
VEFRSAGILDLPHGVWDIDNGVDPPLLGKEGLLEASQQPTVTAEETLS